MNTSMMTGVVLGGAVALSIGAFAGYKALKEPDYAQVLAVSAVNQTVDTPQEVCSDVVVKHKAPVKDENRIAGTVIGGVLGGVVGHQVGKGTGKDLATIAGAAGGAYAGNTVQKNMQEGDTKTTTERRCKTVVKSHQKVIGYDVKYALNGKEFTERTATKPSGDRLLVENGKLVLGEAAKEAPSQQKSQKP